MKRDNKYVLINRLIAQVLILFICLPLVAVNSNAQKIYSGRDLNVEASDSQSLAPTPTPILFGDNPSCAKLNTNNANFPEFDHIISDYELRLNYTPPIGPSGPHPFTTGDIRVLNGIPDPNNFVTIEGLVRNRFNWTSTKGISAIIVKGGSKSFVYPYPEPAFDGQGLTTPDNSIPSIDFISFCYFTPATVTIIKEVQTFNGGNASTQAFPFTATNFGTANFSLVDNNAPPADRITNVNLYNYGAANAITVTEGSVGGWSLSDLSCVETAGGGGGGFPNLPNVQNSTTSFGNRRATIVLEQGENVVCTFKNLQAVPTAASAFVSGRVLTETGLPLRRAAVSVFNANTLETQTVYTNQLGYYRFDNLMVNNFYIVTVSHGKRAFSNNSQSFTLNDNLAEINFYALY
jgi:hypothetical protein